MLILKNIRSAKLVLDNNAVHATSIAFILDGHQQIRLLDTVTILNQQGEKVTYTVCGGMHGISISGSKPAVPNPIVLRGQHWVYRGRVYHEQTGDRPPYLLGSVWDDTFGGFLRGSDLLGQLVGFTCHAETTFSLPLPPPVQIEAKTVEVAQLKGDTLALELPGTLDLDGIEIVLSREALEEALRRLPPK